ncbi:HMG high mobility group box-containing protein [Nitzschia inconspicua]|uniref:HMG high mobility group box-containing protein n=1 Tax=Nitzschia inconspicua TaxID=303405 RepID=A0A9K3PUD8_9STRA|nr:HMG high mobility group box-containing protein [Nitzschia inconspicua]
MFFSTQKHKEIREERTNNGENTKQLSTTEVAKMVSQAWKDLSEEDREKWEELGRKDKARYEMEKAMYSGPWKVPVTTKREKDPTRPKRPMSAFLSYSNRKRGEVKEKHKNAKTAEVSRILAQMWKEAPPEEKKEFVDEEYRLRQDYKVAMAAWKERTSKEFTEQREARENEAMKLVLEGKLPPDPFPLTSATALPTGAEYSTKMAEDTFNVRSSGQQQSGFPSTHNAGYLGEASSSSVSSAAFQPPLDQRRSADSNSYMYGAYLQPPPLYAYPPSAYPGYNPQTYSQNPQAGNAPGALASVDPQHYPSFPPYYQFDPNSPFRHHPF